MEPEIRVPGFPDPQFDLFDALGLIPSPEYNPYDIRRAWRRAFKIIHSDRSHISKKYIPMFPTHVELTRAKDWLLESPDNVHTAYVALASTHRSTWNPRAMPETADVLKPMTKAPAISQLDELVSSWRTPSSTLSPHDSSPHRASQRRTSPGKPSSSLFSPLSPSSKDNVHSHTDSYTRVPHQRARSISKRPPTPPRGLGAFANLTYAQLRAPAQPGGIIVGFVFGIGALNTNRYGVEGSLSRLGKRILVRRPFNRLGGPLPRYAQRGTFADARGKRVKRKDVVWIGPFRKIGVREVRSVVEVERKVEG